ncbi:MAG: bifunctional (p)ppGpp synthetase/guanosine-3',5'-bis(diphosphate) 3'-pyrophosphohydrolase [Leptospiraceae bacterium]|nr:bifunctional (p)ppGpp synthetase/guanosine-3',5'-bis(diphosphate) 3'-pyrophosphohydrolase [Leptospiraceae bacterium]MCK6381818.1 bifunctional (p)ppGpp synthetase/guanosine-3',5'-bis(diphosphate) 3'-pyrophosphohydrolase [Leptospiraceae bacterium]NUM40958.1 bifunctional (p)ppGpp synthetase/guanosine-3',5'-bis(diphosphate) 3'-pyrophosphohydrolase [Leptospiraceae bacterium]
MAAEKSVSQDSLFKIIDDRFGKEALQVVQKAYNCAKKAHEGQSRLSGEPYIIHPLSVGYILAEMGLDYVVVAAGLLHDIVEDTYYTKERIQAEFGQEICELVEGVTKISEIKNQTKENVAAENIRKMVLATIRDIRVILIKLADKTHNMRTLKFQPLEKRNRIANETLSLYAPIAGRLGIYKIKSELEDLSFQILHPNEYQEIKKRIASKKSERNEYIEKIKIILKQRLSEINIQASVEGRAKHFYSIYRKMKTKEKGFSEIFDLRGIRIIAEEMKDCYGVLGIVHTLWAPVPGRFKDYIATPKTNLYQSLHTTVIGPDGVPMEVQIRTNDMNQTAEYGIAAHWSYKEGNSSESTITPKWIERLKVWQDSTLDPSEFLEELTFDLHEDEVFVFTPKGEIIELPKGSTILDFAFRIHTDIGLYTKGAKINGRMVPIRTELKSGDQIEIITDKKNKPSPIWLRIVKTSSARQKLRQYFRKLQEDASISKGNEIVQSSITKVDLDLLKKQKAEKKKNQKEITIIVAGIKDIMVRLSGCCSPLPGDEIIGFITRGRGVSVHKSSCEVAKKQSEKVRMVAVRWGGVSDPIPVWIEVRAYDRQGIYLEMVECITRTETNIIEAGASSLQGGTLSAKFQIQIEHNDQLQEILDNLKSLRNIISAGRVKGV